MAIANKISKTPTTIRQILKIFVNCKSKFEALTVVEYWVDFVGVVFVDFVDELDVLVDCEDVELDKFISAVAAKEIELLYNKLIIKIPIIKNIFDNFDICKNLLKISFLIPNNDNKIFVKSQLNYVIIA